MTGEQMLRALAIVSLLALAGTSITFGVRTRPATGWMSRMKLNGRFL